MRPGGVWARLAAFLPLLPLAWSVPARAQTEITVSNQLDTNYDTSLEETVMDDRLDALVHHGAFRLGVTFLSHTPSDYSRLDPHRYGPQENTIRKRYLETETDQFQLRVGDVYGTFGRGLALQIYEDRGVDFDNVLSGVSGRADLGRLRLTVIGGTNSFGEPGLILKGGSAACTLPGGVRLGAHGVWADYVRDQGLTNIGRDQLVGGFLAGSPTGRADIYGEYVVRIRPDTGIRNGHAGYANLNLDLGPVQLLTEVKDLLRYDLPQVATEGGALQSYVNPPTAVRQHSTTLLNRATHVAHLHPEDEQGALVEAYLNLPAKTRATGSYSRSWARYAVAPSDTTGAFAPTRPSAWETYGELERWFGDHVELILRLDETEETIHQGGGFTFYEHITGGGSLVFPLSENWTCDLTQESQETQRSVRTPLPERFAYADTRSHLVSLTVSRAPDMSWAVTGEWTTDRAEAHRSWLWGEWNLRLGERHQLTLGGGRLRGGQLCSGGVCRLVNPFEGGRLELLTTF